VPGAVSIAASSGQSDTWLAIIHVQDRPIMRLSIVPLAAAAVLSGCLDPIATDLCVPVPSEVVEQRGDTLVTTTGLKYVEGEPGTGPTLDWCSMASVHYTGYLLDGAEFDSSRGQAPLTFMPGFHPVITGFTQGVIGMRPGGTRRLIIPPELGYGPEPQLNLNGEVVVPANSTLVFDVELVEVAPQPGT
jgi:FKBP-type peptidyl-prolyl cis-trans isomerase FkpA